MHLLLIGLCFMRCVALLLCRLLVVGPVLKWLALLLLLCRLLVVGPVLKWLALLLCRLLVVGPVLKWLALLLCRLLVVGPVLKWLALLFFYLPTTCSRPSIKMVGCIYVFLRVHSPGHTFGYFRLKFRM